MVVRLAPFSEAVLQHFIYLERPIGSTEPDGEGFTAGVSLHARRSRDRASRPCRSTTRPSASSTRTLSADLNEFVARVGEKEAFCGDRNLQISRAGDRLPGLRSGDLLEDRARGLRRHRQPGRRRTRGERRTLTTAASSRIREELQALKAVNPAFSPAHPAAVNPVLRRPVRAGARVWLENEDAAATVDLANTAYMLMLRLLSHSYLVPRPHPVKALCIDLALGLMRAMTPLAERLRACRRGLRIRTATPACRSPRCAMPRRYRPGQRREILRRASARARRRRARRSPSAWRRARGAGAEGARMNSHSARNADSSSIARELPQYRRLAERSRRRFQRPLQRAPAAAAPPAAPARARRRIEPGNVAPTPRTVDGVDYIEGRDLTLIYEGSASASTRASA